MNERNERVFVSLSRRTVIDLVGDDGRSVISGQSLAQIRAKDPDAQEMDFDDAIGAVEEAFCSAQATRITEDRYLEALAELPPLHYRGGAGTESFKSSERTFGSVTAIYCQIGDSYWSFHGRVSMSHDDIVKFCQASA